MFEVLAFLFGVGLGIFLGVGFIIVYSRSKKANSKR